MITRQEYIAEASEYHIANLGWRPHNPSQPTVRALLDSKSHDKTILMLKPGFFPNHYTDNTPLQIYFEGFISALNLDVLCTSERNMTALESCEIYRKVMPPNEEDENKWGVEWKNDLTRYLASAPVFSYLIEGSEAEQKMKVVKKHIRNLYARNTDSQIIRNIAHVAEYDDFNLTLQVLFLDGLNPQTLEDSKQF